MENKKSGFGTAGLVLGIIGICTCIIPIINNASFIMGLLAIIFGIISLVKKASKGKAITALILGILSIVITLSLQSSWSNTLDNISNDLNTMSGDNTEDVLKNNVDVSFGKYFTQKILPEWPGWSNKYGFICAISVFISSSYNLTVISFPAVINVL